MQAFPKIFTRADEHRSGDALEAFDGRGMVRLLGRTADGLLLERLDPATPLSTLAATNDSEATRVLTQVIAAFAPEYVPPGMPPVADWAPSFARYGDVSHGEIPADLVRRAHRVYVELCRTQRNVRLLHGDLHHDNVLFDAGRGWVAIDPKGVVGEPEYELGAALRNPIEMPHLFTDPAVIDARIRILSAALDLDADRITAWAFAQAILATIWLVEDGEPVTPDHPWITLARCLDERCSSF